MQASRLPVLALSLWFSLISVTIIFILIYTGGKFFFTLDDPYIHLAVARNILSGGFGVNLSEYSSPSSSILWPYLLSFTEALNLGAAGPLLLCGLAAGATVWVASRILEQEGVVTRETPFIFRGVAALFCVLICSATALPLTGMEHSLHVMCTVVTFSGLLHASRGHQVTWITVCSIICLPLIRFEGFAFAGTAILCLIALGQVKQAVTAATCIAIATAAYIWAMLKRGLPILPSSVLMKSAIAASAYTSQSPLGRIGGNIAQALSSREGQIFFYLMAALIVLLLAVRPNYSRGVVYVAVVFAGLAHVIVGTYGWFYRYEVYIVALTALACLVLFARDGSQSVASRPIGWAITVVGLAIACIPYTVAIARTPHAALVTFSQQAQMARFTQQFFRKPVAVNDLGLVSYGNSNFVLDLWGLGSEQVRKAKLTGHYGPAEMDAAARSHQVDLAMIYDKWFPMGVPEEWKRVAVLHTPVGISQTGDVAFYSTSPDSIEYLRRSLQAFAPTLPRSDKMTFE